MSYDPERLTRSEQLQEDLESVGVRPSVAAEVIRRASMDVEPPDVVADITDEEIDSGL